MTIDRAAIERLAQEYTEDAGQFRDRSKLGKRYEATATALRDLLAEADEMKVERNFALDERDDMRAQRDTVRRQRDAAESTLVSLGEQRDVLKARVAELEGDRASAAEAYDVRGLRVAELESTAQAVEAERDHLLAILRAIWPVCLAGCGWVYRGKRFRSALGASVHTARAALTPELLAALKAAVLKNE